MNGYQKGKSGTWRKSTVPLILISLGVISLAIGGFIGITRTEDRSRASELETDLELVIDMMKGRGPVPISTFDPVSMLSMEKQLLEGRSASFKITSYSGMNAVSFYPDQDTFNDMNGGREERGSFLITVAMGDGSIEPGELEVILREG